MKRIWKLALPILNVYEGEDPPVVDPPVTDPADPPVTDPANDDGKPKFTQRQLNDIVAKEKGKFQKQVDGQIKQLELLQKSKGLSDREKADLQGRIEELQGSLLTKEQLAAKDKEKLQGEYKRQLETVTGERDFWQKQYHSATITRTISDEAVTAEAYNPRQVVALLESKTRLVEALDGDGQPVPGQYVVKVKMDDVDAEGKPTTLDLTVAEALKRMKDRVDEYGNLFRSGVNGGLGASSGKQTKDVDPSKMTPSQFREWRKKRGY